MIVNSYVIDKDVLIDTEYQILCDISGAWNAESSFAIKTKDIKESLESTIDMNTGEEVTDCSGRVWIPDYDSEINFLTKILKEVENCEYLIIQFDYNPNL